MGLLMTFYHNFKLTWVLQIIVSFHEFSYTYVIRIIFKESTGEDPPPPHPPHTHIVFGFKIIITQSRIREYLNLID
jgi:hypothetical protein